MRRKRSRIPEGEIQYQIAIENSKVRNLINLKKSSLFLARGIPSFCLFLTRLKSINFPYDSIRPRLY